MKNFFVLSVLGASRSGLIDKISETVKDYGCDIEDGRIASLGAEAAMFFLLSGSWDAIAKIESAIPRLEQQLDISIAARRTRPTASSKTSIPYAIEVISVSRPGIVYDIVSFFSFREINIEEMTIGCYDASYTGASMSSVQMTVSIPAEISIATLRNEFLDFCDQLNFDSIMEPVK